MSEPLNKIDPLILAAQYEREINRMKNDHSQMLDDLHKELEILRSKNRGIVHQFIVNLFIKYYFKKNFRSFR